VAAAAYGVPDAVAGDQVMVALEVCGGRGRSGGSGEVDPEAFAAYLESRFELPELWWPRYVRLVTAMPRTATNKIVVRDLVAEAWLPSDPVFLRDGRRGPFRAMTEEDRRDVAREFEEHGRTPPGDR